MVRLKNARLIVFDGGQGKHGKVGNRALVAPRLRWEGKEGTLGVKRGEKKGVDGMVWPMPWS